MKRITVKIKFKEESPFKELEVVLQNITEIHYLYPSVIGRMIAFESDIDSTGITYDVKHIAAFEAIITN